MTEAAAKANQSSKANGALMRIAPLAIFGCYMPVATLTSMAAQDARLSHPNPACQSCNTVYCAALGHLVVNPGDRLGAIAAATAVAQHPTCDPDVSRWLRKDSLRNPEDISAEMSDGLTMSFCRWSFVLAFMWLRSGVR